MYNTKKITLGLATATVLVFSSCNKDDLPNELDSIDSNSVSDKELDAGDNTGADLKWGGNSDFYFFTDKGHAAADVMRNALTQVFVTASSGDFEGFLDIATDPYIQHSPDFADGWAPVWDVITNRPAGFSSIRMDWTGPSGYLDNGNFLVMFREVNSGDGSPTRKKVDLMFFDEEGKYAEHWDIEQALSETTASGNSETGTTGIFAENPVNYSVEQEEKNKETAVRFINLAFNRGALDWALDIFVYEDYIQHNPLVANGREAVKEAFANGIIPQLSYDIKYVVAQNDLVVVYSKVTSEYGDSAVVDIFRVREGMLVEHWDVIQAVPAAEDMPHNNTMF